MKVSMYFMSCHATDVILLGDIQYKKSHDCKMMLVMILVVMLVVHHVGGMPNTPHRRIFVSKQ